MAGKMTILVAGGAGFIGSHLVQQLVDDGHHIIVCDNLITGLKQNLESLIRDRKVEWIESNIVDLKKEQLSQAPDQIYNLACPASPRWFQPLAREILECCSQGHQNLLNLARECNSRILFSSTSEIYGEAQHHPQREKDWGQVNPIGGRSCYNEGKRFAESMTINYQRLYGVDVRIARIFNTFGENMRDDDGRVIPTFIRQAVKREPLTVHGDGQQTRSFIYVDDMVAGLKSLMACDYQFPVNLGNPQEMTIMEVADTINIITNNRAGVRYLELPTDDPPRRQPDINLAAKVCDWSPQVSFGVGLRKILSRFSIPLR